MNGIIETYGVEILLCSSYSSSRLTSFIIIKRTSSDIHIYKVFLCEPTVINQCRLKFRGLEKCFAGDRQLTIDRHARKNVKARSEFSSAVGYL